MSASRTPHLSFVVPVFDEEDNVAPLAAELAAAGDALGRPYEIVFVNDGSRDRTLARLGELHAADARVRVVDLEGNLGEAAALSAGFAHARGALIATLDGDGQNDPADVPWLLAALAPGIDAVSGRRHARRESFVRRVLPSRIANSLIAWTTGVPVHDTGCGLKLYRREVVRDVQLPRGMHRFLPAIAGVPAGRVAEVWVRDRCRNAGRSHYGLARTFAVLRDLPALPTLVRRAAGGRSRYAGAPGGVAVVLVLLLSVLGWPKGPLALGLLAVLAMLTVTAAGATLYGVARWERARREGVFRVRRVLE
jgi:glycosyltransferase involved in cell wall biosynthesis